MSEQRSVEPPLCPTCQGKGWVSPDDAQRGIEAATEMFNAGYEAGKKMAADLHGSPKADEGM